MKLVDLKISAKIRKGLDTEIIRQLNKYGLRMIDHNFYPICAKNRRRSSQVDLESG